ncbi:MAG: GrpB family protein [Minisyncoccia bacterium]
MKPTENRKYSLSAYDPSWANKFLTIKDLILKVFVDKALRIEHVGSTSIEGMVAKPLIDVLVIVEKLKPFEKEKELMTKAGYEWRYYTNPDGLVFYKLAQGGEKLENIHICEESSEKVREFIVLRDYLRVHTEKAREYSELKQKTIKLHPNDYPAYREAKAPFLQELKNDAYRWEAANNNTKILLTSNGFTEPLIEQAFLEMIGERTGLKVAIIPTASDPIEWVPEKEGSKEYIAKLIPEKKEKNEKWLNDYKREWIKRGYDVVIADLKDDSEKTEQKLESVDVIDVTGGDVNYLLDWARKSKLNTYLRNLLDRGVVYIGTSAGSGLLNPDIGLTWWEPGMSADHVGLGFVDFVVVPHQKVEDSSKNEENLIRRKKYLQSVTNFPWRVYLLQDGQAIKVIGDNVEHIGSGIKKFI